MVLVAWDDLSGLAGQVVMVDGSFDPLHDGHIGYFEQASQLGSPVLCNVTPDSVTDEKHPVLLQAQDRARVLDALKSLGYIHVSEHPTVDVLRKLRPIAYVKGPDWKERLPEEEAQACAELNIEIAHTSGPTNSSRKLLSNVPPRPPSLQELDDFEVFLADQDATGSSGFDEGYFADTWRDNEAAYTLEARRQIEGRHPALVSEVFSPAKVLDAGCGPGILMLLLGELGLDVTGVDHSDVARELAAPAIRSRIHVAGLTELPFTDDSFDLVICREVLEHIPLRDYLTVIGELRRVSSRFVYVTTRFYPNPHSLFDVTTEFDVDPTHITLAAQSLVRLMFTLFGMRRRPDLEGRIDWMGKGRVLIYEKL